MSAHVQKHFSDMSHQTHLDRISIWTNLRTSSCDRDWYKSWWHQ